MTSVGRLVPLLLVLLTSCTLIQGSSEESDEQLVRLASRGVEATYAATYRFELTGPLAPAVTTRLEIVQDPPTSIRKLEAATPGEAAEPVTVRHWQVTTEDGDFVCTDYADVGVQCLADPLLGGTFGSAQVDEFFDLPARENVFTQVVRTASEERVSGETATCFEATAVEPLAGLGTPDPEVSERSHFQLCYSREGILLRGRKTVEVSEGADARGEVVVEAVSVSRVVEPSELRLPGPVVVAEDL